MDRLGDVPVHGDSVVGGEVEEVEGGSHHTLTVGGRERRRSPLV